MLRQLCNCVKPSLHCLIVATMVARLAPVAKEGLYTETVCTEFYEYSQVHAGSSWFTGYNYRERDVRKFLKDIKAIKILGTNKEEK